MSAPYAVGTPDPAGPGRAVWRVRRGTGHRLPDVTLDLRDGLTVGPLAVADARAVHEAVQDLEIRRWLLLPRPYTLAHAKAWCTTTSGALLESGQGLVRAIRRDGELVGCLDAKHVDWRSRVVELAYWAAPKWRARGHMSMAVAEFSRWLIADELFERVELRIATDNAASRRVADRAGFLWEGTARNAGFTDSGRVDLEVYAQIQDDVEA